MANKREKISDLSIDEQARRMFLFSIPTESPLRELVEKLSEEEIDQLIISGSIASGAKRALLSNAFMIASVFMQRERSREQLQSELETRIKMVAGFSMQQKKFFKDILLFGYHPDKMSFYKKNEFISILTKLGTDKIENNAYSKGGVDIQKTIYRIKQNNGSDKTFINNMHIADESIERRLQGILKKANLKINNMKKIYMRVRYGRQRAYPKLEEKTNKKDYSKQTVSNQSNIPSMEDFD